MFGNGNAAFGEESSFNFADDDFAGGNFVNQANAEFSDFSAGNGLATNLPASGGAFAGAYNGTYVEPSSTGAIGSVGENFEGIGDYPGLNNSTDLLEDETLDNFGNGEGDFEDSIDKFDVRVPTSRDRLIVYRQLRFAAVAQDTFDAAEEFEASGNFAEQTESEFGQNNFGQANFGDEGFNDFNGNFENTSINGAANNSAGFAGAAELGTNGDGYLNNGSANFGVTDDFNGGGNLNGNANVPGLENSFSPNFESGSNNAYLQDVSAVDNLESEFDNSQLQEPDFQGPDQQGADQQGQELQGQETATYATPSAGGRPVELDFRGAPLTEVIRALGEESGVNFVLAPALEGQQVHINLNGVPFNDALQAVLEAHALGMVPLGPNVVRIDTAEKLRKQKEDEEARKKAEARLQPTKWLVHRLSYAKAEEAVEMLQGLLESAKKEDERVQVQIDKRTNAIIVNANENVIATVKALMDRLDLQTPQVKIASRIIEVKKNFADSFGISWGGPVNFDPGRGLGFGNLVFPNYMISRYSIDAGGKQPASTNMNFKFGSLNKAFEIDLALSMEETRGTTEILQSNDLVVEDNTEAQIVDGTTDFFRPPPRVAGAEAADEPIEVNYNLSMIVKPHVTADGAVQLNLDIENAKPVSAVSNTADTASSHQQIKTSLLLKSGETAVIGGVYQSDQSTSVRGVPILSAIPIIGALFRSNVRKDSKKELLVMVTPTILGGGSNISSNQGGYGLATNGYGAGGFEDAAYGAVPNANFGSDFDNNSGFENSAALENTAGFQNISGFENTSGNTAGNNTTGIENTATFNTTGPTNFGLENPSVTGGSDAPENSGAAFGTGDF